MSLDTKVQALLIVGQYIIIPLAYWVARNFKKSIINDLKSHVDVVVGRQINELSTRIGRIESALIAQGLASAAKQPRAASGRFQKVERPAVSSKRGLQ